MNSIGASEQGSLRSTVIQVPLQWNANPASAASPVQGINEVCSLLKWFIRG